MFSLDFHAKKKSILNLPAPCNTYFCNPCFVAPCVPLLPQFCLRGDGAKFSAQSWFLLQTKLPAQILVNGFSRLYYNTMLSSMLHIKQSRTDFGHLSAHFLLLTKTGLP